MEFVVYDGKPEEKQKEDDQSVVLPNESYKWDFVL